MQQTTCLHCGNQFFAKPSVVKRGGAKYCSKQCEVDSRTSRAIPLEQRFWKHIQKTEYCWLWAGSKDKKGYGRINRNGSPILAHRLSWEIHFGLIPDGLSVLHRCDNPPCCNPEHLFLGDQLENMQDCSRKDRTTRGERSASGKLTTAEVTEIRSKYAAEYISQNQLAEEFGVSPATISEIIRGVIWNHTFASQATLKPHKARGSKVNGSKLVEADIAQIRSKAAQGVTQAELATEYGVSRRNINRIVNGKTWKHAL